MSRLGSPPLYLQSSSLLIFKLLEHRIGIAHLCQWQNFILREVVHGRSGEKHIKLFVRLYAIDPGTTMTAHNVVAALELSVGLEFLTVVGLLHHGFDHLWRKP